MASLRRQNVSCATCGKTAGIFTCRGCSENFCLPHTNEHRELLEKQMNEIILIHNQLKQAVTGQTTEQFHQSLLQQIERWEQQSIEKIHRLADDTRQQLSTIVQDRTENIKEKIAQITQQLNKARYDGEFFESEIKEWSEKLNKFQQLLTKQQKVKIQHDKNSTPFISKISLHDLSTDNFVVPINEIQYETNYDNNSTDDQYEDYLYFKEKNEYSTGEHSIRFKIDQYELNSSILFGITSKNIFDGTNPYENSTLYGWTGNNIVYRAGNPQPNYHGYKSDIKTGDIFMLTMNCDREMISLTNERTGRKYDLEVDIIKCPFPWQPNVRFFNISE
ncbi:unnamed protein product [Rotaria sp. Silwood1]|nr:unnamed protein product [Rotaria sp. Silwood1]CAF1307666.1 unnamed protein product [Rotaria sp. Silwood1]CAF1318568.1 unnamed protein product [Rotaria sp. Silwood1]CAF3466680.1 unnamed protein product [Rotaria sp. Silwood1]CAF3528712.1 unnamed protein product [Rotaria sp. Silwood1]